jgi:polyhydroxyalkanoate synthase
MQAPSQILETQEIEQQCMPGRTVRLVEEVIRVEGEVPLFLVRKYSPDRPARAPVLLVHGLAQNRFSWHTSRLSMSAWLVSEGWETWNLELRGHGRGRAAGVNGAVCFDDYVADVLTAAAAIGQPSFWVGHSMGGAALYGAGSKVETQAIPRPRGVVGIGAVYSFARNILLLRLIGWLTRHMPLQRILGRVQIRTAAAAGPLLLLPRLADSAALWAPISGWWPGSMDPKVLSERLKDGFDWSSLEVWHELTRWSDAESFPYDTSWQDTDLPLLVIAGDKDQLMPPSEARLAHDRAGSADKTLVIMNDWDHEHHWGHLDLVLGRHAPDHTWTLLHEWMSRRA